MASWDGSSQLDGCLKSPVAAPGCALHTGVLKLHPRPKTHSCTAPRDVPSAAAPQAKRVPLASGGLDSKRRCAARSPPEHAEKVRCFHTMMQERFLLAYNTPRPS